LPTTYTLLQVRLLLIYLKVRPGSRRAEPINSLCPKYLIQHPDINPHPA
jgi:hypothetical protein